MNSTEIPQQEQPAGIGAFAPKTELSKLLRQTRAGKSFITTQRGTPIAELRRSKIRSRQRANGAT